MNGSPGSPPTLNCAKKRRIEEGVLVDMEIKENFNKGKLVSKSVSEIQKVKNVKLT